MSGRHGVKVVKTTYYGGLTGLFGTSPMGIVQDKLSIHTDEGQVCVLANGSEGMGRNAALEPHGLHVVSRGLANAQTLLPCCAYRRVLFKDTPMPITTLPRSELSPKACGALPIPSAQSYASRMALERVRNNQFVTLLNAFRHSGGLARAQEVAARFKRQGVGDISPLAAWLVKREVVSIEWQSKLWLPLFQFHPVGMTLRAGLSNVLAELVGVYNDWEMASWFAQPNPWLADNTPADSLAVTADQVLEAARAERFAQA